MIIDALLHPRVYKLSSSVQSIYLQCILKVFIRACLDEYADTFDRAERLLEACSIDFAFQGDTHKNLLNYGSSAEEDEALLLSLCHEGLTYRYPDAGPEVMQRLEKELHLIREKKFVSYFLINWDIVNYARSKDFYYVGRGSGANSSSNKGRPKVVQTSTRLHVFHASLVSRIVHDILVPHPKPWSTHGVGLFKDGNKC